MPIIIAHKNKDPLNWGSLIFKLVGAARFELTASCTRNKRATKLRYAPTYVTFQQQK